MGQNLLGFTIIAKAIHLTSPAVLNSYREPLMWEYLGGIENGFNPLIYWVLFLPAVAVPLYRINQYYFFLFQMDRKF